MNTSFELDPELFQSYRSPTDRPGFNGIMNRVAASNRYGTRRCQNQSIVEPAPRLRKVGQVLILPDDTDSSVYAEIPIFYDGEDLDLFLGKFTKSIGRFAKQASRTIGKTIESVKRATGPIGGVVNFAWRMSPAGRAVTWGQRGFDAASRVARGERIDRILRTTARAGIEDVKEQLKFAEMVAPFVPGIGTGVAAALGAANALASGKPITDSMIAAARSAIRGGRLAQTGFDLGMNLVRGKNLSQAMLATARSQLPGGRTAQVAFDTGIAIAQGRKIQAAAYAAAGRILPPSPYAANALSFARAASRGHNIQHAALSAVGRRVLRGKRIYKKTQHWKKK